MLDGSAIPQVQASELRAFIERIERLREQVKEIKEMEKEVFEELKGRGYMKRPVRTIIKRRAEDPEARAEHEAIVELYQSALGV